MAEYTIDKIEYDGNVYKLQDNESGYVTTEVFYGTCTTAADTAAKVVTCANFAASDLKAGTIIVVNFSVTNSAAVADLTLNINGTGAKKIQYINNGTRGNLSSAGHIKASTSYPFIYDGTYWLAQINYNSNTTYSAGTAALIEAGTDTSNRVWQAKILHDYIGAVAGDGIFIGNESTTFSEFKTQIEAGKAVFLEVEDDDEFSYYPLTCCDLSETQYKRLEFTGFLQVNSTTVTVVKRTLSGDGTWTPLSVSVAPKASPAFTGTPTAPTATAGTNTTQIATTAFVKTAVDNATVAKTTTTPKMDGTAAVGSETMYAAGDHVHPSDTSRVPTSRTVNGKELSSNITLTGDDIKASPPSSADNSTIYDWLTSLYSNKAPLASPALTGIPTAPTATTGTNTTQIATTAFVKTAIEGITIPTITLNGTASTSPSFYAPTTVGTNGYVLKSNGSGAPTWTNATLTDTKVTTAALTSGTLYYPILATSTGTATRQIDSTLAGLTYRSTAGTASTVGSAQLKIGNSIASGTANNEQGQIILYGSTAYAHTIVGAPTAARTITLPNKTGTVALTSDITVTDVTVDGTSVVSNGVANLSSTDFDFIVPITYTESMGGGEGSYLSDFSYTDIIIALTAGKNVFAEVSYVYYDLEEENWYYASTKDRYDVSYYDAEDESMSIVFTKVHFSGSESIQSDTLYFSYDGDITFDTATVYNTNWTKSTSTSTFYPLVSTAVSSSIDAKTPDGISYYQYYNTAGGYRRFNLGNATAYKSSGGAYGTIRLYGTGATYYGDLNPGTIEDNSLTANRTWTLPDKTGTVALTSDIYAGIADYMDIISGTPSITGTNTANYCTLRKVGNIVEFHFAVNFSLNLTAGTNTKVGTIPYGFRPVSEVSVGGYILGGTYGFVYIKANGDIELQRVATGTSNVIRQHLIWITNENVEQS